MHETASISSSICPKYADHLYIETEQGSGITFFVRPPRPSQGAAKNWVASESPQLRAGIRNDVQVERAYVEFGRQAPVNHSKVPAYTVACLERTDVQNDLPPLPDSPIAFADNRDDTDNDWKDVLWNEKLAMSKWSITGQTSIEELEERDVLMDDTWSDDELTTRVPPRRKIIRLFNRYCQLGGLWRKFQSRKKLYSLAKRAVLDGTTSR